MSIYILQYSYTNIIYTFQCIVTLGMWGKNQSWVSPTNTDDQVGTWHHGFWDIQRDWTHKPRRAENSQQMMSSKIPMMKWCYYFIYNSLFLFISVHQWKFQDPKLDVRQYHIFGHILSGYPIQDPEIPIEFISYNLMSLPSTESSRKTMADSRRSEGVEKKLFEPIIT